VPQIRPTINRTNPAPPIRFDSIPFINRHGSTRKQKKVPKLLEQNRQPVAHGRAIVDSKDQFLTNWEIFTKGMFKGLDWTNIFIAGGAVLGTPSPLFLSFPFFAYVVFIAPQEVPLGSDFTSTHSLPSA